MCFGGLFDWIVTVILLNFVMCLWPISQYSCHRALSIMSTCCWARNQSLRNQTPTNTAPTCLRTFQTDLVNIRRNMQAYLQTRAKGNSSQVPNAFAFLRSTSYSCNSWCIGVTCSSQQTEWCSITRCSTTNYVWGYKYDPCIIPRAGIKHYKYLQC